MNTVQYLALIFFAYTLIKAIFFTDRSPIPETSGSVHKIASAAQLRALLASTTYVVVDFYADWCPPCRAMAPVFSQLADAHAVAGRLAFAKVNVDHVKDVAAQFNVTAMPTFVFFRDGLAQGVDVDVDGVGAARSSVVRTGGGLLVERVRGADKVAVETVVRALAAEVGGIAEKE
ncbi:thioredoxin-like protein [Ustulina deusta]|nr:thioredoxin-like protein [Ustulina deusta]